MRARASEHPCNFGEQFEQRPNFASTLKLNGTSGGLLWFFEIWSAPPKHTGVSDVFSRFWNFWKITNEGSFANKVEHSHVRNINFKSAKKMKADLDETVENLNKGIQVVVFTKSPVQKPEVPVPTQAEMANFYLDVSKWKTKPVLLSLMSSVT